MVSKENNMKTIQKRCVDAIQLLRFQTWGYFHIRKSEIPVVAPNSATKNVGDKYPKFCPSNVRYIPKIEILSQLFCFVVTELPKFFLLFDELGWNLHQILPPNLMSDRRPPP